MPLPRRLAAIAVLCLFAAGAARAVEVGSVEILGLDEEMTENVRVSLSLVDAIGTEVSGRRMGYLVRTATDETREALEPFGFYSPTIEVERNRDNGKVSVIVRIEPGEPVRVRNSDIAIIGEGGRDRYLQADIDAFIPSPGAIFTHADYEASKVRISRRLTERGYFDADFSSRRVEVTRAQHAADIDLVWTSGERYDMGPTTFEQERRIIRDDLLEKLVYWEEGQYYHQGRLDRLRTSLAKLDYFGNIEITPDPAAAIDKQVPVTIKLTPAKRSIYTSGLSYGTDSGAGVRLGVERRYVNTRGHKALAQLDYAQKRKTLTAQYRIPAFAWRDGWYTVSAQAYDEQTDYIDTRRIEFVGSRSGQYSPQVNLVAAVHVLRERWAYASDAVEDRSAPVQYRYATFSYPAVRAEYANVDNLMFPTSGIGGWLVLRSGVEGIGSDANFVQLNARASTFKGIGENSRLILRAEAGYTWTNALVDMPPSLRFYAGGDRSIRGYEWREVGPRITRYDEDEDDNLHETGYLAIGAKNVLTASIEYERYFLGDWGAAVFVDSGSAFDGSSPDWHTGVGIGARWRSPVGPLKLDFARGLDDPDSSFTIGLSIGVEF
ncbi:MAG TPA: autotransporter assembly complex family protein [Luteimonas sp.]|nr:autotransporter assembly complex family protein [Luteimonas sp.]HRO27663.1 autotransporter assembly complex family protein [Luteimonas sp.]HRP72452.1 autotransporter assembly complex family protein [Luteimonas sp.]